MSIMPTQGSISGAPLDSIRAVQQRIATLRSITSGLSFAGQLRSAGGPLGLGASSADQSTVSSALGTAANATGSDSLAALLGGSSGTRSAHSASATQVIGNAISYLGVPYQWGGNNATGIDCSGLTQQAFRAAGIELPRVAADQARQGTAVSAADAQPGDLVFFGQPVDHVGIYLGNGQMVNAPHTGTVVRIESVNLAGCSAIRRVVPQGSSSWASALPTAARPYATAIARAAEKNGVDPALLASVAWQESGFRPRVASAAGAQRLIQLMPATAAGMGVRPPQPGAGSRRWRSLPQSQLDRFDGKVDLALAAYNAGPTAVARAGGVPTTRDPGLRPQRARAPADAPWRCRMIPSVLPAPADVAVVADPSAGNDGAGAGQSPLSGAEADAGFAALLAQVTGGEAGTGAGASLTMLPSAVAPAAAAAPAPVSVPPLVAQPGLPSARPLPVIPPQGTPLDVPATPQPPAPQTDAHASSVGQAQQGPTQPVAAWTLMGGRAPAGALTYTGPVRVLNGDADGDSGDADAERTDATDVAGTPPAPAPVLMLITNNEPATRPAATAGDAACASAASMTTTTAATSAASAGAAGQPAASKVEDAAAGVEDPSAAASASLTPLSPRSSHPSPARTEIVVSQVTPVITEMAKGLRRSGDTTMRLVVRLEPRELGSATGVGAARQRSRRRGHPAHERRRDRHRPARSGAAHPRRPHQQRSGPRRLHRAPGPGQRLVVDGRGGQRHAVPRRRRRHEHGQVGPERRREPPSRP